ncbi:MAG TPA: hypothetical protein VGF64_14015 [Acidimicrobiales bacterium]|jgi:hypothetical protein
MTSGREVEGSDPIRADALAWLSAALRFEQLMGSLHAARDREDDEIVPLAVVGGHHRRGGEDRAA